MTTVNRNDSELLDPSLFDRLREVLGRPDLIDFARRRTAPATVRRTRSDLRHLDLRSWRD